MKPDFGPIMQHGYVVNDVTETAQYWAEKIGVGPFYLIEHIAIDQYYYRGAHTELELKLGFAYWGNIQIELIQQLNEAPTLYSEAAKNEAGKLNHCATIVENLDSLLETHNLNDQIIQIGQMPTGLKYIYLDQFLPGGYHLELIEAQESTLMAFKGMEAVAKHWDGNKLIRPMEALKDDLGG